MFKMNVCVFSVYFFDAVLFTLVSWVTVSKKIHLLKWYNHPIVHISSNGNNGRPQEVLATILLSANDRRPPLTISCHSCRHLVRGADGFCQRCLSVCLSDEIIAVCLSVSCHICCTSSFANRTNRKTGGNYNKPTNINTVLLKWESVITNSFWLGSLTTTTTTTVKLNNASVNISQTFVNVAGQDY